MMPVARYLILSMIACYLWWASMLTTGRPPIEMWPTNTPTPAHIGIWSTPIQFERFNGRN